jgi:ribosomal protein S18 acetylase RimI-like enzyme
VRRDLHSSQRERGSGIPGRWGDPGASPPSTRDYAARGCQRALDISMQIRSATFDDLGEIISFDRVAQSHASRVDFIKNSIERHEAYVSIKESTVVGYVVLDYSFYSNGFISMLYIAEGKRHRGYGSGLIEYVESICKTSKVFTSTNESNVNMQALLEKLGYEKSGWIDNLDEGDPEIIYFKRLDNEAR